MAQTTMAAAIDRQETYANRTRDPAYEYQVGDKVWLDLRNIRTDRPSKKLDFPKAKYTILEKVSSYDYRLNTPPRVYPIFYTTLLRPASKDLFLS